MSECIACTRTNVEFIDNSCPFHKNSYDKKLSYVRVYSMHEDKRGIHRQQLPFSQKFLR